MADERIKDISTQARAPAVDDFLESDGLAFGTRRISPLDLVGYFANSRAHKAALYCDSSDAANRPVATLPTAAALGTDPRGFFDDWTLPPAKPAALTLLWCWGGSASAVSANSFAKYIDSTGAIVFRLFGSNVTDYRECRTSADVWTTYGAMRSVLDQFGADSAGRDFRMNGLDVTLSADTVVNTNGTAPADWVGTLTSTYLFFEGSLARRLQGWWPCNFRPSLADAQDSFFIGGGVPERFKWASEISLTTGDNATFDSDAGFWSKSSATIAAGVATISAGGVFYRANIWAPNKVLRTVIVINSGTVQIGNGTAIILTTSASGTYQLNAGQTLLGRLTFGAAGGAVVDSVYLYPVGALFQLSPAITREGGGFQLHDIGPLQVDLSVPTSGWSWTQPAPIGARTVIRGSYLLAAIATASGTTSAGVLPASWDVVDDQIEVGQAADTGRTLDLGTSGTPAKYVAALAIDTIGLKHGAVLTSTPNSRTNNTNLFWRKSGSTTTGELITTVITIERKF